MPRLERVFVDTATLYPISLADLVLRLAELAVFELLWSDHLLAEVERVLVDYKGLTVERAAYFCQCIRQAFPEGRVSADEYLPLVASRMGPDPDDHLHSAAAVAGAATVVLSADKTGYPPADIAPARRRDPDAFLTELAGRHPQEVVDVVDAMGVALREPLTREQILDRLAAAGVPRFAARVAGWDDPAATDSPDRDGADDRWAAMEAELGVLQAENARLRGLLGLDDRAGPPTAAWKPTLFTGEDSSTPLAVAVDRSSPPEAKVALFRSVFAGRDDVHALRWDNERTGKAGWGPAVRGGWANARRPDRGSTMCAPRFSVTIL